MKWQSTSLLVLFFFFGIFAGRYVVGQVRCYQCLWTAPNSEPGARGDCRPKYFNGQTANIDLCLDGCKKAIMYEVPGGVKGTRWSELSGASNENTSSSYPGEITFYSRGCAQRNVRNTKLICETSDTIGFRLEECYCNFDYCNGSETLTYPRISSSAFLLVVVLLTVTVGHRFGISVY